MYLDSFNKDFFHWLNQSIAVKRDTTVHTSRFCELYVVERARLGRQSREQASFHANESWREPEVQMKCQYNLFPSETNARGIGRSTLSF